MAIGSERTSDSGTGAASGGGSMGPAAIMVGGQFLANYLAQKAAEEEARKQRELEIIQEHQKGQQNSLNTMGQYWANALGR